ncbi:MAG TPA: c-type cytochrome [Rhodocyclaceae bacterium]|nr:c-type cytochrome [Rhodocyclaceae bacterium]
MVCFRHRLSRLVLLPCLLVLTSLAARAQSPEKLKQLMADPGARAAAADAGRKTSSFCANCHGADGNSKLGEVPNLAGQNPVYLLNQVHKFYTGERKDQWMEPAIKLLSESERLNIVVFYAGHQVTPASSAPPNNAGREIFFRVCARCHGEQAQGGERFPRLAGQQNTYLVRALTNYRNRTGTRMEPEMLAMTAALKDADIKAVADYLSALR